MLSELLLIGMKGLRQKGQIPLHRQLYDVLKRAILDGSLASGERLPSSRILSNDLRLSRNTVITSLNQLVIEGYLVSRTGSGTYINDNLPKTPRTARYGLGTSTAVMGTLSKRGQQLSQEFLATAYEIQPFPPEIADFSSFPIALWRRLQNKHWRMTYPAMLDYTASGGYAPLRRAVADYLRIFRSVPLESDQVIITNGTQQSLQLCAKLLADSGDTVWIEDPAYWGAVKSFMATDLKLHPIPVDNSGIYPKDDDLEKVPRLIYTTPSHQYPTGEVMSLARRRMLLDMTHSQGSWIIEDDYDSEFRFSGLPISSLAGLDDEGRVLYMGSFSKVLYPGLKLAYLVVPKNLTHAFKQVHYDLNRPGQLPIQAALAEFIELGHFTSTLRLGRISYGIKRQCLLDALAPCLQLGAKIYGTDQGLHLCLYLPPSINDKKLAQRVADEGMIVRALSSYCLVRKDLNGLVIGYGYATTNGIREYGHRLAAIINAELKAHSHGIT